MGNHTNFKGMFNKERIENLEKRVKELERKEDVSRLSEDRSKRLIHALVDSNNEVVKRIFDDVYVTSVYGVGVFQPPKAGDIHASNAVFSGEVFKVVHPITANEVVIQAIPRDTISCNGCAFRKGDLESMCKAYLCMRERTLDCLVFKVVKEKFK